MKKTMILSLIICILLIGASIPALTNKSTTKMNHSSNDIDDTGWFTSIALDENNRPHISYYDYTAGDLKYCTLINETWQIETIDAEGDVGKYTSLALDEHGKPHISYYDASNDDLKYAVLTDNIWTTETIDQLGNVGLYTSIDIDSNNQPHISYCHYDLRAVKYAHFNGYYWKKSIVDNSGILCGDNYLCDYTSLALDSKDTPHISYCDYEQFNLKYAHLAGPVWQKEIVDDTGNVGIYSSLAIDANDQGHISYAEFTPHFNLKYAHNTDEGWNVEIVDEEGDVRKWTSLILDNNQQPHISYYDYSKGSLEYIYLFGHQWKKETIDLNGSTGCFNSITLDSEEKPFISYYDWGKKALKIAAKQDHHWTIDIIEKDTNTDFIDQEQSYCSGYSLPISEDAPLAQSFIPQYPVLTRVELMLVKRYNPGNFTVSIREQIEGNDIVSTQLSPTDIPEDLSWKTCNFPDIPVQLNQTYYLVCTSEETEQHNMYYWYFGHNDPYPLGDGWMYHQSEWELLEITRFPLLDMGFKTFGLNTSIPSIPTISGPTTGEIGVSYTYVLSSEDADEDQLYYTIEWSSVEEEKIGPFSSGEKINITHLWSKKGEYTIRVKAIDEKGAESDWATLPVSMPKQRKILPFSLMRDCFEHHPKISDFLLTYIFKI